MKILLSFFILLFSGVSHAQTVEEIKADNNTYIWGEGTGTTLKKADKEALNQLISQISTRVESKFELLKEEVEFNGNGSFKETCQSVVNTYSDATLKNTDRIVMGNEPDARVFRYIKRDEVIKVFAQRRDKIIGFVENAEKCIAENKIADGLRYYYWSLILLKSHPYGGEINYWDAEGKNNLLATWLPLKINEVFSDIDISIVKEDVDETMKSYILNIKHKDKVVENFDYSYWDGGDWSNIVSAKDGYGIVDFYGASMDIKLLKLKVEYIFEGEARIDHEVEDVLSEIDPIPFRKSYFNINTQTKIVSIPNKKTFVMTEVKDKEKYEKVLLKTLSIINSKDYSSAKEEFTSDGYNIYEKLIKYGNAKVLDTSNLHFVKYNDKVICRSVPMSFNFKTNNKEFVENVIFQFDDDNKIDNLSFELSSTALNDIVSKEVWPEYDRITLINFLENYKTAYALKRIDYIDQIFADDALIITGTVVKVKPIKDNYYKNEIVKYNRQSKKGYIKKLNYLFKSKEFVNIKFEKSKIRKAGKGGDIYGVQIKQNYVSSNYGDEGYLFLMIDMNNPEKPIIHVRTWQPSIEKEEHIYGLSDFN
ncbi:MAG: LPP20 family lipoprotein [Flavobacteriales bacterium]|nr:LPP20 family lipoprotein [Flavobacteriales bacterium]